MKFLSLKKYFKEMFLKKIKIKKIKKFCRSKRIFITTLFSVVIMLILISSLVFLSGCEKITGFKSAILDRFNSEKQQDAVVAIVNQFFNFIIVQDYDSAYALIYIPPESPKTLEDFKKEFLSMTKIVSIEVNWVEIKNNIAIVGVDMIDTYDGEEKIYKDIQVSLVKGKDESWKINFWNQ
jgi:hypothetical protein